MESKVRMSNYTIATGELKTLRTKLNKYEADVLRLEVSIDIVYTVRGCVITYKINYDRGKMGGVDRPCERWRAVSNQFFLCALVLGRYVQ